MIRGLLKRYPKLRGYRFGPKKKDFLEVNFDVLEKQFASREKVSPATLLKKGIIRRIEKRIPQVKILGKGRVSKALIIENCKISKTAKEKIEKAGGIVIQSQKSK